MKKMVLFVVAALMGTTTFAQSQTELMKQQQELNKLSLKMINIKPSKDAKKQAKTYKKDGWRSDAGDLSMEKQFTKAQIYGEIMMPTGDGGGTQRYMQSTMRQTGGSYNAAKRAATVAAQTDLASRIETKLADAWKLVLDNAQDNAVLSTSNDKFNERTMGIVKQSISTEPVVSVYRVLPNNNYQVEIRLMLDKKATAERLKRNLKKELELEGTTLDNMVDDMMCNDM